MTQPTGSKHWRK